MRRSWFPTPGRLGAVALATACLVSSLVLAEPSKSDRAENAGREGKVYYVSRLGDDSDGSGWQKAFRTIQKALLAVPDDRGGHRIVVRPDTYVEANLYTRHKGAEGGYNLLVGDVDGRLGSGAVGRVVIDSGDLEKGFKSYDWWSTIRATSKGWRPEFTEATFSSICWDRWVLRNLYVTGSDAGLFWDLTNRSGEGFTVIVEDCVGIGRAFGGGVCYPIVRPKEPSVFRRSYFLALDWVGDSAAVLVGGHEKTMPEHPHLILDDCTLVHPDNALAMSYASHCARVRAVGCRMIALNFTQPEMGGKSTGVVCTQGHRATGRLHVDLEDCILAGYSVLTPGKDAQALTYTVRGKVLAYVQFKQPLPDGFKRLGSWPVELFDRIAPPKITASH